jgi:ABC-type transporter Mla subunit MlaD
VARKEETRARRITGVVVFVAMIALFIVLFSINESAAMFEERATVRADFRTITGLRPGSPVQLAGVKIGKVASIDFVSVEYACIPLTEDVGRFGEGRTDDCDRTLFCAPSGQCAGLEHFSEDAQYAGCLESTDCAADEICYTSDFRRRESRVVWAGPQNVCVRFDAHHSRVRVELEVFANTLQLIRRDSVAMIASNSVLGDQLVSISPGVGEPLGEDLRVLSRPSLSEDIEQLRERLDRITRRLDSSMTAISQVLDQLNDPRVIGALKGTLEHLEAITGEIATQRGLVGALIGSEEMRDDIGVTLAELRSSAQGFEQIVGTANHVLLTTNANIEPIFAEVGTAGRTLGRLLADLQDPSNRSLGAAMIFDEDGEMAEDLEQVVSDLEEISHALASVSGAIERGDGTVGKLLDDPKLGNDVRRLLGNLQRSKVLKSLLLFVLEKKGVGIEASRNPAAPPRD